MLEQIKSLNLEGNTKSYPELIHLLSSDDRELGEKLLLVEQREGKLAPALRARCDELRKVVEKCDTFEVG